MKLQLALSPLLSISAVLGSPGATQQQFSLSVQSIVSSILGGSVSESLTRLWGTKATSSLETWSLLDEKNAPRTFMKQDDITYELLTHPNFPQYKIRVKSPKLCDPSVKQYSGYLDIDEDKHLFFWFFESRKNASEAPLVLWLNGGPGCSSSTGLLFELGPCMIADHGLSTKYNKYGWNEAANMIFLDQPINVGYSYSEHRTINNTPAAAEDVYAFLQLFLNRYSEYDSAPFSVAAESYGGHYAPHIASTINKKNKAFTAAGTGLNVKKINLSSVVIGNGITDPYTQMGAVAKQACDGPYPIYDDPNGPECRSLRSKIPMCQRLVQSCYNYNSRFTCVPAELYCNIQLFGSVQKMGLNPYDTRKTCNHDEDKDGPLCYKELQYVETYLNNVTVKHALGVASDIKFQSCSDTVGRGFIIEGDGMKNSAALIPELLEDGIRLLIYAGNADFVCNAIGNLDWMENLKDHPFTTEFSNAALVPWQTLNTGKIAGMVKSAGGGGATAGNFTYVVVHESGHMVPADQPEAALDLISRWLSNSPLA